jgi:hypothetical protein
MATNRQIREAEAHLERIVRAVGRIVAEAEGESGEAMARKKKKPKRRVSHPATTPTTNCDESYKQCIDRGGGTTCRDCLDICRKSGYWDNRKCPGVFVPRSRSRARQREFEGELYF